MQYILIIILLFTLELLYFRIADRYNIIDKPNERSSHSAITLRGGGIVFPLAFLLYSAFNVQLVTDHYWVFGLGLIAISTVSFIDDIRSLPNRLRIIIHIFSVSLLLYFVHAFTQIPLWVIPIFYIVIIGALNAYNFMDGINGMTGLFSLVVLSSLWYINKNLVDFVDTDFIIYPILATLVFLFFNFRTHAKCFAGDIGSMAFGFWVIGLITFLIVKTGDYKYVFLMAVYGFDVIYTLIERLILRENIFKAHRKHLYQLCANELKMPQLVVSAIYAAIQVGITAFLLSSNLSSEEQMGLITIVGSLFYLLIKFFIKKRLIFVSHSF